MRLHDAIGGLFFMALGMAVLLVARNFPDMAGQAIGPSTFPTLIGAGMVLGGAIVGGSALRHARRHPLVILDPGWRQRTHVLCVAFSILGSLFFAIGFESIGFPLGALVLCVGIYLMSGLRRPMLLVMAASFVAVVTLVMTRFLGVPLPMGGWL